MSDKPNFFDHFFDEKGPLASHLTNYQKRDGQVQMAQFIDESVTLKKTVVIEAGTGIGKTLGYLLPLVRQNKKIIISTATKNLQEQLLEKDFPILQKALKLNFNVSILKGRSNYLCHHRINNHSKMFFSKADASIFSDIEGVLKKTNTGDVAELKKNLSGNITHAVTSTSENCLFGDCKFSNDCFVNKARRRAHSAEVIIVNHHLFFSDFFNENDDANNLLPKSDVIVFDEAHNLIDLAMLYSSKIFSSLKLNRVLDDLINHLKNSVIGLENFSMIFNRYNFSISQLLDLVKDEPQKISLYKLSQLTTFKDHLIEIMNNLEELINAIKEPGFINKDIDASIKELNNFIELLKNIINPSEKKNALWLEKFNNSISIHITPIDVKGIFSKTTASSDSMVFTSATMTTNNNFDYFKDLTGLKDIETRVFESPFNYEKNALLHIPMGLPNPNEKDFFSSLVDYVYPAIKLNKGRTLFLTTSLNGVEQVANQFEFINSRNADTLNILRQGMLPNQLLIEEFKNSQNSVLIGSFSFWEGIDLIGDNLTLLIIDKLPFKSPDDPIVDAKINLLNEKDFFMKSQIPMTTLLMKQGMGRLIRNFSDKGVAILGDNRIQKKYYGKQILKSLPPFQLVQDYNQVLNFIEELR